MLEKAFQDHYPDEFAHCYGCGRLNEGGLQIKSYWDGDETVCHFTPDAKYSGGFPGFLYGGMIASLLDCHGAATASADICRSPARPSGKRSSRRWTPAVNTRRRWCANTWPGRWKVNCKKVPGSATNRPCGILGT